MSEQFEVEPQALRTYAKNVVKEAERIRRIRNKIDQVALAPGAFGKLPEAGGWKTPNGLVAFADRWNRQVKHLHDRLDGISDKLHDSIIRYTEREKQESASHDKIRQDFG